MLLHDPATRYCSSQHEQTRARGKQVLEPPEPHSRPERRNPCHLFKGNACTTSLTKALELLKLVTVEPKHLLSSMLSPRSLPSEQPCVHQHIDQVAAHSFDFNFIFKAHSHGSEGAGCFPKGSNHKSHSEARAFLRTVILAFTKGQDLISSSISKAVLSLLP